jgi:excisionase family DNA binding protein
MKPPPQKAETEASAELPGPQIAPPTTNFPEVMTIEQVAEYLQLHPQVVYRHIRHGTIPVSRIGRTARVKKSILDQFLESGAWNSVNEYLRYLRAQGQLPAGAIAKKQEEMEPRHRQRFSVDVD